nr:PREDICTED: putative ATP-dependent RNA helicase DHX33 [Bemisia tabaci]
MAIMGAKNGDNGASTSHARKALPISKVRERLVEEISNNMTLILIGETGCGKTTKIPQFIYKAKLNKGAMIAVTQPRRVAAVTIASHVANAFNSSVGGLVGYTVRFEDATSADTKIKFLTDGMLLREAMLDANLSNYSVIILDEAHERTVNTDILFGIVKRAQYNREQQKIKPLKIIVMSATMDVDHFCKYFNNAPVVFVEGRTFPVHIHNAVKPHEDYFFSVLSTIFQLHQSAPVNHDFLVFLTGQEEIESMAHNIRQIQMDPKFKDSPPMMICYLFAALPTFDQVKAFSPTPPGRRKVILSTNIAETSVTISGVKYVIDCGKVKIRTHQPSTGLDMLKVSPISQAQAWQRAGRAGRESEGHCYRAYTEQEFANFKKNTPPEIQRCNLASVVLQLLAIGINAMKFDFMDKPNEQSIKEALLQLKDLGAITNIENPSLTQLGKLMSQFPLDPRYSKILICAQNYECLEEILIIVAMLSSETVFVNAQSKKEEVAEARQKFHSSSGDHITLLKIFRAFAAAETKKKWCSNNFLHFRNLEYATKVRKQLTELCQKNEFTSSSCGQQYDQIKKCLLTGLYMNLAELQRDKKYLTVHSRLTTSIHPTSSLFGSLPPCILFTEILETNKSYLNNISTIDPAWVEEVVPNYARQHILRKLD